MSILIYRPMGGAFSVTIREPDRQIAAELESVVRHLAAATAEQTPAARGERDPAEIALLGPSAPLAELHAHRGKKMLTLVLARGDDSERAYTALALGASDTGPWPVSPEHLGVKLAALAERQRNVEELGYAQRDLNALLDLSDSLINTHDISGTLLEICERLAEVMQADRCSIVLLDDEAQHGFIVAASDDA